MTDTDGDEFDVLEAAKEEPPRIRDPDHFEAVIRFKVGSLAYVHSVEELSDGRLICYLGCVDTKNTTAGAGKKERTFLNYAPVGALVAHPNDDGTYTVEIPDRDALDRGVRARKRRENDHRATVLTPIRYQLKDHVREHAETARETDNKFQAAIHAGMARMASLIYEDLSQRWDAPYSGRKRWEEDSEMEEP